MKDFNLQRELRVRKLAEKLHQALVLPDQGEYLARTGRFLRSNTLRTKETRFAFSKIIEAAKQCGVAGLDYYSEPASAATPTCSTLGVSRRSRDIPYPSRGGRTNHFPSLYPHPGGCKEEGAKKEEAG